MFRKIKKFIRILFIGSFRDKRLYIYAFKWSIIVRFSMIFLPFKYYRGLFGKIQQVSNQEVSADQMIEIKKIRNIVLSICDNTPWESKCLVQAISCKRMLKNIGVETTVYLGVCKDPDGKGMKAHAWLRLGETILTGASGHEKFKIVNFYS